ncbi:hypothetical protein DAEQUDRAFT_227269 [Daedalea quercina L-15889]|uniref:Uncharacterized protein n=1 Tax=Daedalea quercina L-15889 TaxID=1314783 RepID=A0A165R1Q5_9APHY|nr:hypothetical protein DAEQUDRAFT_227269 [Daedalea quercina L-15889]
MAAVLSPSHYGPAHGILINRSPSVSPYHHSSLLPPLVPSNPCLSSFTSSASDLATDSDYSSSSSAAASSRPGRLPHDAHEPEPRSGSAPNSRRIRFAPLPDPRRNIFVADGENPDLPSVFLDDADDQQQTQISSASSGKPFILSLKDQDAKSKSGPSGSLLFSPDNLTATGSTPTLASTATITQQSAVFPTSAPSELGGEWNVLPRSPRLSSLDFPDDISQRPHSGGKWSKKLLKPLLGPLASSSGKGRSTDDLRTSGSTTSLNSMIPLSRQSTAGSTADSCYSVISSPKPLDKKSKKKREKGAECELVREFGTPLNRWSSEGEPLNKKGRAMSDARFAGAEAAKAKDSNRPRSRSANGTRLLNGRVYGAKRNNNANLFASARSVEPEFVEWGFGGMGSVQANGVGASVWAKVQSRGGVSVGAHEEPAGTSRPSSAGDDEDDGSGMAWVKKRRMRKEQEQKKDENVDKKTGAAGQELSPASELYASVSDPDPPAGKEAPVVDQELSASPTQINAALPEDKATPSKEHHLEAVKLPPVHQHHHRGHSHGTLERLSSAVKVETERRDSADTLRDMCAPSVQELQKSSVDVTGQPEETRSRVDSVSSQVSAHSSSSSSSGNDDADAEEADEEDLESPRSGEEEEDEDVDEELEERARLTAVGAGVEKISRHKENVPEAGPE